jgi:hypothetical protein
MDQREKELGIVCRMIGRKTRGCEEDASEGKGNDDGGRSSEIRRCYIPCDAPAMLWRRSGWVNLR